MIKQYIDEFDNGTENDETEEDETEEDEKDLPSIPITLPEEEEND